MNPDERPSKRDAFNAFFGEGWVSIHLDARREGVEVPDEFAVNRHLVLQYGQSMPIPIPDLKVDDDGITATLSFSRTPHRTFVPWAAVYIVACNDGRGILYYEDVPEDVSFVARPIDSKTGEPVSATVLETGGPDGDDAETAEELQENEEDGGEGATAGSDNGQGPGAVAGAAGQGEPGATPGGKRKRPVKRERLLKSVPAEVPSPENDDAEPAPAVARRRKRPQLRVVK
jgi:stringent starvation protein B